MHKPLFAGDGMYVKYERHDTDLYSMEGSKHVGILQAVFVRSLCSHSKTFVLICRFNGIDPDPSNCSVVQIFHNYCYRYCVS